ncbi:MAG: ATP-binding protein [Clostridia bacterium]|nr:ATP-binding protein [Clostridia bacterium]
MYINRQKYLDKLISQKDKDIVKVITGIRRCGKSVLLFNIYYDYLLSIGVKKENIIKINLETKRNEGLRDADALYNAVVEQIVTDEKYYVLIDEVQFVDGFEDIVNGLRVDYNCDVYITGSNSKLLSKDINTKMRGRSIEIKVYPLSFAEFYAYYGGDKRQCFNNYLMYGGLPYLVAENDNKNKVEYLKMICDTVVGKDIIDRHGIRQGNLFEAVIEFLCSNIGSYVSANKIADTLKSNGYSKVTHDTIGNYLDFVCDAYLFYKAQRYDIKGRQYLKTLNKYYIADLGIRNSKLNYRQIEITHSLENIIYLDLIRRGYIVDIGKNNVKEIDFVARDDKNLYYIQVAYTLSDPDKNEQEVSSFYGLDDGYKKIVITMDDDPFVNLKNGYKKINVFDFLLNDNILEEV